MSKIKELLEDCEDYRKRIADYEDIIKAAKSEIDYRTSQLEEVENELALLQEYRSSEVPIILTKIECSDKAGEWWRYFKHGDVTFCVFMVYSYGYTQNDLPNELLDTYEAFIKNAAIFRRNVDNTFYLSDYI